MPQYIPELRPDTTPDFRLEGYEAANDRVADRFRLKITFVEHCSTVLAEHHTNDGQHSYYVMHDGSATWGMPGDPQIVALHLKRDTTARTFRFDRAELPLPAMAQSWLIARGCPEEEILLTEELGTTPADAATRALEERLRRDGDHFSLLHSYTHDMGPVETTVLLRALDERAPMPFRVLLEQTDTETFTHTLREGGFATFEAATTWWEAHWSGEPASLSAPAPPARQNTQLVAQARPVPPTPPRRPGH
ncbi:hypothetical protein OG250_43390 [Streptomyces sp. NBC_00487]|uniref:hypothetical protein n=1 Tax=Streptomyces sp. NBC_00487 TaxID=2903656 RepID=UPI002E182825